MGGEGESAIDLGGEDPRHHAYIYISKLGEPEKHTAVHLRQWSSRLRIRKRHWLVGVVSAGYGGTSWKRAKRKNRGGRRNPLFFQFWSSLSSGCSGSVDTAAAAVLIV